MAENLSFSSKQPGRPSAAVFKFQSASTRAQIIASILIWLFWMMVATVRS